MKKDEESASENMNLPDKRKTEPLAGFDKLAGHTLPPGIHTEFITLPAILSVSEALAAIRDRRTKAVVIRRFIDNNPMYYLFTVLEIQEKLRGKDPDEIISIALDLHESGSIVTIPLQAAVKQLRDGTSSFQPTLVIDNGKVTGYLDPKPCMTAAESPCEKLTEKRSDTFFKIDPSAVDAAIDRMAHKKKSSRRGSSIDSIEESFSPAEASGMEKHVVRRNQVYQETIPSPPPAAAPMPPASSDTPCHFAAQMPEEVVAGEPEQVQITLSREEIDLIIGASSAKGSAPLPALPDQKITVRLIPKRNFDVVGDSRADVIVPQPGEPAVTLYFDVRPGTPGDGELWIAFCRGPVSLVTLKLKPQIVAKRSVAGAESIQAEIRATPPAGLSERVNIMLTYVLENNGKKRYKYCLMCDSIDVGGDFESPELNGDIMTVLKPYMDLFDKVETGAQDDFDQLQLQLRSIGAKLFQTLFPKELQRIFWENRDKITHLKLYCEEPYIPWEILHVCEPGKPLPPETKFLGQMGLVRWLHGHTAPTQLRVRPGRAWYVTPAYRGNELEKAKQEGQLLETLFAAKPVSPATRPEVTKLLGAQGPFDLFHFAGHGQASEAQISESRIELEASGSDTNKMLRDLTPDIVSGLCQLKAQDGTRPIVVLNSCRAGKIGSHLTGLGGFAPAFLEREAGVFVGALWMIGDEPALTFIQAFYEALSDGKIMADAVKAGREKARLAGDATYLAYVVYADPFAHLVQ